MDSVARQIVIDVAEKLFVQLTSVIMQKDDEGNEIQGIFYPNPGGCFEAAAVWTMAKMKFAEDSLEGNHNEQPIL